MKLQILKKQHLAATPEARSCSSGAWLHSTLNLKSIFFFEKPGKV